MKHKNKVIQLTIIITEHRTEQYDVDYDTEIAYKADKHNEIIAILIALVVRIFPYLQDY